MKFRTAYQDHEPRESAVKCLFQGHNRLARSGGYWVRRMRQLPRAPLENTTYSFILLYMFFLEIVMILGEKYQNMRSNRSEDLFFF